MSRRKRSKDDDYDRDKDYDRDRKSSGGRSRKDRDRDRRDRSSGSSRKDDRRRSRDDNRSKRRDYDDKDRDRKKRSGDRDGRRSRDNEKKRYYKDDDRRERRTKDYRDDDDDYKRRDRKRRHSDEKDNDYDRKEKRGKRYYDYDERKRDEKRRRRRNHYDDDGYDEKDRKRSGRSRKYDDRDYRDDRNRRNPRKSRYSDDESSDKEYDSEEEKMRKRDEERRKLREEREREKKKLSALKDLLLDDTDHKPGKKKGSEKRRSKDEDEEKPKPKPKPRVEEKKERSRSPPPRKTVPPIISIGIAVGATQCKDLIDGKDYDYLSVCLRPKDSRPYLKPNRYDDLSIVCSVDVSSSMQYALNYDWDEESERKWVTKLEIATRAIITMLFTGKLKETDRFGMIAFNQNVKVIHKLKTMKDRSILEMEEVIKKLKERGGCDMEGGLKRAIAMIKKTPDYKKTNNRIVFLTCRNPRGNEVKQLRKLTKDAAKDDIYVTFVGIGCEFQVDVVKELCATERGNYFSVHSQVRFEEQILDYFFDHTVSPLRYTLSVEISGGTVINKVYTVSKKELKSKRDNKVVVSSVLKQRGEGMNSQTGFLLLRLNPGAGGKAVVKLEYERCDKSKIESNSVTKDINLTTLFGKISGHHTNVMQKKGFCLAQYVEMRNELVEAKIKGGSNTLRISGVNYKVDGNFKKRLMNFAINFIQEIALDRVVRDDAPVDLEYVMLDRLQKQIKKAGKTGKKIKTMNESVLRDRIRIGDERDWLFRTVTKNDCTSDQGSFTKSQILKGMFYCPGKTHNFIKPTVEICFSFDTTGSMKQFIAKVRKVLKSLIKQLMQDIPSIRIAIIAHGDYNHASKTYAIKVLDFCNNLPMMIEFIKLCEDHIPGGDWAENYEQVLMEVRNLKWSKNTSKCFVMIGDAFPHKANTYFNIDWEKELELLKKKYKGIKACGVQCGNCKEDADHFFNEVPRRTQSTKIQLQTHADQAIVDVFMHVCYQIDVERAFTEHYTEIEQVRLTSNCHIELSHVGGIGVFNEKELIMIHDFLHKETGKSINIRGYPLITCYDQSQGRYIRSKGILFIQHNNPNSLYKGFVKDKFMTFICVGGSYGYIISKK